MMNTVIISDLSYAISPFMMIIMKIFYYWSFVGCHNSQLGTKLWNAIGEVIN